MVYMSMIQLETGGASCHFPDSGPGFSDIHELVSSMLEPGVRRPSSSSGSGEEMWRRTVSPAEDRKRRRMESNRESARRSRLKKKRHIENLTGQVNRLRYENRELNNRLGLLAQQVYVVRAENERLRSECITLVQRLLDVYPVLDPMQLH